MYKYCKHNLIKYIYFILIFISGIIFISIYQHNTEIASSNNDFVKPMRITGFYQEWDSDEWIPFNSYDEITTDSKEITICAEVNEKIQPGIEIMFCMYRLDLKILINGDVFYESNGSEFGQWDSFLSPGIKNGDEIRFIMRQVDEGSYRDSYRYMLNRMYYGTKYSLLKQQIKSNIIPILICALTLIVGVGTLFAAVVLALLRISERRGYLACGLLLISGAVCTFINYEYITLIFDSPSLINIVDILFEAMICEFLMLYLKSYICTEKYIKIVNLMACIWPAEIVFYFICRDFKIIGEEGIVKIILSVILIMFFVEIIFLLKDYFKFKNETIKYVLISGIMLLGTTIIEIVHFLIKNIYWIYVFQGGLLLFTFMQLIVLMSYTKDSIRQAAKARKLEAELVQNNVAIMLSQIQPHFLYNSLTTIGYLCEKEPKTARRMLNKFSDYLRVNMDSLKQNAPVPFSKELEHVKTYLELEKMRFDDDLNVEYDIDTTGFMIPVLTVQPIIENAVKHGIGRKEDGGTVRLSVKETDSDYVICVEDDGVGFNKTEKKNDSRTHVGISNVSERLEAMSGGELFIKSEKGIGTTVIIKIPKERTKEKYEDNSSR